MKIGDKVKVIDDRGHHDSCVGEILTIEQVQTFICVDDKFLLFNEVPYCLSEKRVKLIKTNMKKSDLKDGMICKLRDGHKCLFLKDKLYRIIDDSFLCLSLFSTLNENLINKGGVGKTWDIVEVQWLEGEVIWQREEPTELTMQEIADKFNIEVTNLKIKK